MEFPFKKKIAGRKPPTQAKGAAEKESLYDLLIHDLTGPLSVISASAAGLLGNAERSGSLTERQRTSLERISRNADKARDILREMIEILRSEEGWFRKESFPPGEILKESILDVLEVDSQDAADRLRREKDTKRFWKLLEPQGIFVEISGKYRDSPFCHDPRKVRYILRNLVSNAWKYRRKRIEVFIRGEMICSSRSRTTGRESPKGSRSTFSSVSSG